MSEEMLISSLQNVKKLLVFRNNGGGLWRGNESIVSNSWHNKTPFRNYVPKHSALRR
jgi:hypothetical protein